MIPNATTGDTTDQPSGSNTYTVKLNDSLYKIASQYGISVQELINANNLTSPIIQVGQVLVIPSLNEERMYTVQRGDSLWSIANRFNTTVNAIRQRNNLTTDVLQIGQTLIIP